MTVKTKKLCSKLQPYVQNARGKFPGFYDNFGLGEHLVNGIVTESQTVIQCVKWTRAEYAPPLSLATPLCTELTETDNEPPFRVFKLLTPKKFFFAGLSLFQGERTLPRYPWLRHWYKGDFKSIKYLYERWGLVIQSPTSCFLIQFPVFSTLRDLICVLSCMSTFDWF